MKNFWIEIEKLLKLQSESRSKFSQRVYGESRQRYNVLVKKNLEPSLKHLILLVANGLDRSIVFDLAITCYLPVDCVIGKDRNGIKQGPVSKVKRISSSGRRRARSDKMDS